MTQIKFKDQNRNLLSFENRLTAVQDAVNHNSKVCDKQDRHLYILYLGVSLSVLMSGAALVMSL